MEITPEGLRRIIEEVVDSRLAAWRKATVAIAKAPEPKQAPSGWITDRVPAAEDGDSDDEVKVPARFGVGYTWIYWNHVHPGTPWSRTDAEPGPWYPATLNRNGWIRSRLPTWRDASTGEFPDRVLIPCSCGPVAIPYHLVVPTQPWAPWDSKPGDYQP